MKLVLPTERDREAHRKAVEALLARNAWLSDSDENAPTDARDEGDHRA